MTQVTTQPNPQQIVPEELKKRQERARVWQKAKGMWKNRKPDPIKELEQSREEWRRRKLV